METCKEHPMKSFLLEFQPVSIVTPMCTYAQKETIPIIAFSVLKLQNDITRQNQAFWNFFVLLVTTSLYYDGINNSKINCMG